jgi:hypothetical protein
MKSISIIEMLIQTYHLIYISVTLIASNLGARDVIVHFEIVFIFFLFTILSPVNLETRGDPFEMRFFKISARSNNNFLRPYFSSHLISEFRALSITSMTSVVEYQYWVYKIKFIFAKKWPGLKDLFVFFELEECRLVVLKVSEFQNEFMKSSFLPNYELKIVRTSAL